MMNSFHKSSTKNTAAEGLLLGGGYIQTENQCFDSWVSILCHYQGVWCLEGHSEEMSGGDVITHQFLSASEHFRNCG